MIPQIIKIIKPVLLTVSILHKTFSQIRPSVFQSRVFLNLMRLTVRKNDISITRAPNWGHR